MQIKPIHTPCKDCIFAEYTEVDDIQQQQGCYAGMIEVFEENGAELVEVYDNDKEFYVINGVRCHGARSQKWLNKQNDSEEEHIFSMQELVDRMKSEWKLPYHAIILCTREGDVYQTIDSLSKQTIPPNNLTVVIQHKEPAKAREIFDYLTDTKLFYWKLKNIHDDISEEDAIKMVVTTDKYKFPYVAIFYPGCVVPQDTFKIISDKVYNELLQFTYIEPNSNDNGKIIPLKIYNTAKAMKITVDDIPKKEKTTYTINELCPNFPN